MNPRVLASCGVLSLACGPLVEETPRVRSEFVDSGAAQPDTEVDAAPPADLDSLGEWLAGGNYRTWRAWSEVGPSLGSGGARVYLNDVLERSLSVESNVHPRGSSAVRELYADDFTTLIGYSILLKVSTGNRFTNWYSYEVLRLDGDGNPSVAALGAAGCEGCHAQGRDFVRSTLPLP